jgi:hypothetical protein
MQATNQSDFFNYFGIERIEAYRVREQLYDNPVAAARAQLLVEIDALNKQTVYIKEDGLSPTPEIASREPANWEQFSNQLRRVGTLMEFIRQQGKQF